MNTLFLIAADAPQSGKSTAATYLAQILLTRQRNVERLAFAAPLKRMLNALLKGELQHDADMTFEALTGNNKEGRVANLQSAITYRKLMQTLGTEWRESTGVPTLWGEIMLAKLNSLVGENVVIIDDFRFPLEGNFLIENLNPDEWVVKTIKVVRGESAVGGHSSEGGLKDRVFDHVIENKGTVTDLYGKVKAVLG
jgi:hypothetical protein